MAKESDNKEDKKEVREKISCEKCSSHYVYVLADKSIVCRRCGHRATPSKK